MKKFSKSWRASKNPKKQRKYIKTSPLHIKRSLVSANLSKTLREKHARRSLPVRKGDKVKIMRGQFRKIEGNITKVNLRKGKINIEGADHIKKDGSKASYPIHPSNIMITELNLDDKLRQKIFERKTGEKKK